MSNCYNLPSTVAPDSLGSDSPPPPAYIRRRESQPTGRLFDKCNPKLWIRFRQPSGKIEVVGKVHAASKWPKDVDQFRDIIYRAAQKHWVPPAWIAGWICQESLGVPKAVSYASAIGLMQIIMSTAKWLSDPAFPGQTPGHVGPTAGQLADPELNIDLGTRFLRYLAEKHDDNVVHMAAQYNHGSVECGDEDPPPGGSCPQPMHDWRLITNCGYVDGIIGYVNLAIDEGYFGFREIAIGPEGAEQTSKGSSLLSIGAGVAIAAGAAYGLRRLIR